VDVRATNLVDVDSAKTVLVLGRSLLGSNWSVGNPAFAKGDSPKEISANTKKRDDPVSF
jgi:hypothetical protein